MNTSMRQKLTVQQILNIASAVPALDPGLSEMLPAETINYLQSGPDIIESINGLIHELQALQVRIEDLNLALVEYANESGQGQMMLDNLKLCLDQVRMRKNRG